MIRSALYRGTVTHARRDVHAQRTFRYPVYLAALALDELPLLDRTLRLFSHNRRNLFALADRDYEAGAPGGLAAAVADLVAGNQLPAPATTRLVTNLSVLGYVFNPVSFFLNYGAGGALSSVIAEVNNTYGGRRRYLFGPRERIGAGGRDGFRHVRELFVSPFLHGRASYQLWLDAPLDGDALAITMHVDMDAGDQPAGDPARSERRAHPAASESGEEARVFVARFAGTRYPLTDRGLATVALRYPLMTAQVIGLIHYQAWRLRRLGAPYRRPGSDHRPISSPTSIVSSAPRSRTLK